MNKILFVSNTANFSKFNTPFMKWFLDNNWEVDYASAGEEDVSDCSNQYKIDIKRSPFTLKNLRAFMQLKKIILNRNYDIIHCHTPMGGVIGRLAARNSNSKIIYTAHGFHFFKGSPVFNWLFYFPVEKILAKYTDVLITINEEDYLNAKKYFSECKKIFKINGVGVDLTKFNIQNRQDNQTLRNKLNFQLDDFIIVTIAEINNNKNQKLLIKQIDYLSSKIRNFKYILIGKPASNNLESYLKKKGFLDRNVFLLGYRNDIKDFLSVADIVFSSSKREGLCIAIIEAMASGSPIVCSNIRGHEIDNGINGLTFSNNNVKEMKSCILKLYKNKELSKDLGNAAFQKSKLYNLENVLQSMSSIYNEIIKDIEDEKSFTMSN